MSARAPADPGARRVTVSLVVIGNEVLSGKVEEQNAAFLIKRFRALGARLREVAFVEDDPAAIAEALLRVAPRSDHVLTTGGVGPTHDDVTVHAVARALGLPVVEDPAILQLLERHVGEAPSAGTRRLARVPEGAELVTCERIPWPVVKVRNIWLFPGIPPLMRALFGGLEHHFGGSPPLYSENLELVVEEAAICEQLDALVARHPAVEIGSYPRRDQGVWCLRLTFDGADAAAVASAHDEARATFAGYVPAG